MPKPEPKNPIRCMFCNLILGVQGLSTHIHSKHKEEWDAMPSGTYDDYVKQNKVKKNDTNNPLRNEWRAQNGLTVL